jgi:hypothetical protein
VKKRLQELVATYGAIGLVVYLTSTCLVYFAFLFAIQFGFRPSGAVASGGVWVAAYLGAKVTQPFRIIGTMAITPVLAKAYGRITGRSLEGGREQTSSTDLVRRADDEKASSQHSGFLAQGRH